MLTYALEERGKESLYEFLYKQIKQDILKKKLLPNEKLPSKRNLARHLDISTITVENAYSQLVAEGYLYSIPKSGFYVSEIELPAAQSDEHTHINLEESEPKQEYFADFVNNSTQNEAFPFSIWTKILRETVAQENEKLLKQSPSEGIAELRCAIANYLYQFRGMTVDPSQIIIGAGTEYLYGLLIQLLGHDKTYAVEDPGYQKIARIYLAHKVRCEYIPLDSHGIDIHALNLSGADILHLSPSHHFPSGLVTPISRRYELLSWAAQSECHYIIEDDYDSEFRLLGKPIPSLQSIDLLEKVIYMNTFSKSLSSTIRISYMVLPKTLMMKYKKQLGFYACTVSNFEQYTLAAFINSGHFEKHINRMRNHYRMERDILLSCIQQEASDATIVIREENAGLHFLLDVKTSKSDFEIVQNAASYGIHISALSEYYYDKSKSSNHTFVINYSGISQTQIPEAVQRLLHSLH